MHGGKEKEKEKRTKPAHKALPPLSTSSAMGLFKGREISPFDTRSEQQTRGLNTERHEPLELDLKGVIVHHRNPDKHFVQTALEAVQSDNALDDESSCVPGSGR